MKNLSEKLKGFQVHKKITQRVLNRNDVSSMSIRIFDQMQNIVERQRCINSRKLLMKALAHTLIKLKYREEQIEGTRQKPQWIVTQGYSRTYNSRMQQSRLQ